MSSWVPATDLVDDAARTIGAGPSVGSGPRFEQLAWASLLQTAGPALLTRDHAPMHLTASAAVLDPSGGQTCLVLHRKLGLWLQPGGHIEPGDLTLAAAAAREVEEETGLTTTVQPVPVLLSRHAAPCNPGVVDWHLDVQFVAISPVVEPRPSDETPSVQWYPVGALPSEMAWGVTDLIEAAVRALD